MDMEPRRHIGLEDIRNCPAYYVYEVNDNCIGIASDILGKIEEACPDYKWLREYRLMLDDMYDEINQKLCEMYNEEDEE